MKRRRSSLFISIRVMMVNMAVMKLFIWIYISYTLGEKTKDDILNATACFSDSRCNSYDLKCPQLQKIRLLEAEYRYKLNEPCSETSCDKAESCCHFSESDCKTNYSQLHALTLYRACSGKQQCENNKGEQGNIYECAANTTPRQRYIHVKYRCTSDEDIMNICDGNKDSIFATNLIFNQTNKFTTPGSMLACKCFITSKGNQKHVSYNLVDIRLFTANDYSGGFVCSNSSLQFNGKTIQCMEKENSFTYMGSHNYHGEIPLPLNINEIINLFLVPGDLDQMVWIYVYSDKIFDVRCSTEGVTTITTLSKEKDGAGHLSVVLPIVGVGIIIIAVAVTIFIVYMRRRRKLSEKEASKNDLPNGKINPGYESAMDSDMSNPPEETSNYDCINDDNVLTYCKPVEITEEDIIVAESEKKFDRNVLMDEYDIIEFGKQCAMKAPNYDSLPATESHVHDGTYSHISSQSKSLSLDNANEYSHCKSSKRMLSSDGPSNKEMFSDQRLGDGDCSHFDLDTELKKEMLSDGNNKDPYHHINFNKTTTPVATDDGE